MAAYFMTADGRVLGASLGAATPGFFLEEATWAVEAARGTAALARAHAARSGDLFKNPFRGADGLG